MKPKVSSLLRCFQGVIPSTVATVDPEGIPNITYVSHVTFVDDGHIALSRQFFNKTARNLESNPRAALAVYDPVTYEAYELTLRHARTETSGPLFDAMKMRIEAIASHTGMNGVFRLLGADVFDVLDVERKEGFIVPREAPLEEGFAIDGLRTELRGLQFVAERVCRAECLDDLLESVLEAVSTYFGFSHTRVFLLEEPGERLVTFASRGYDETSIGAEVRIGEGIVGTVARERRAVRIAGLREGLSYGRAVRREVDEAGGAPLAAEIPLSGLADAESAIAIPLTVGHRLLGVLAAESRDPLAFDEWDEGYFDVIGHQIALGIDRTLEKNADDEPDAVAPATPTAVPSSSTARKRVFTLYKNDDAIFVDGEYLIRNVPARILWRLLTQWAREGRTEFTNRELRLDPTIGLPALRDNLESRLVLLRRRLEEKCPDILLARTGRGRFALSVEGPIELVERESAAP